ncbi:hypothetical protein PACTADRAFT_45547 [Pachysolen tannophilus NRRL Y-2460]|uniref:Delta 8-(E)-sphingolipid desaturase n=1 Tax=Pachysolen tannophilus NRRL Y-2460 TaxID=669874 RepID=A0A1E4TQ57_PACTA|nr:hypothetical protein PACTADRAFT_45547 [Pachysolen tannophilus NRRL Y-2460]
MVAFPVVTTTTIPKKKNKVSIVGNKNDVLSPRQIEHLIAIGYAIVIYEQYVLKLNGWLAKHPGGDLAIFHMIGRDASDEMNAYHCDETVVTFKKYAIGRIDYKWENMLPPIQGGIYKKIDGLDENLTNKDVSMKPVGTAEFLITPRIPQGEILSLDKPNLFTSENPTSIRDPKLIIENYDNNLVKLDLLSIPSLDYKTQRYLSHKYNLLHENIISQGFYKCPYIEYFKEFCRIGSLFLWCLIFLKLKYFKLSAFCLGCAWQQAVFSVHDAGHISITHNYTIDNVIGMLIASFFGGLSLGWWKRNHNVHHLIPNDPVHDPDIQHLPFFAVSSRLMGNVYSTYYKKRLWFDKAAKILVRVQRYTYYLILAFGRFNLYRLSMEHLILGLGPRKGKAAWFRYFELLGLVFFSYWFCYLIMTKTLTNWQDRLIYLMISHVTTMLVHVQITLSHFAMSTSDLGTSESFVSRQIRTTMDVDCPEWFDYFHGGLQFQAIHHLFPRLPRHNFRKVQPLVIKFCEEVGLKYSIYGFVVGNGVVLDKMGDIGQQVGILRDCLKNMKSEKIDGANYYEKKLQTAINEGKPCSSQSLEITSS